MNFLPRWALAVVLLGACALASILGLALNPPHLRPPPREDAVISGVTVLNPGSDRAENQTIVISDGQIAAVRPRAPSDPVPMCAGCIAIPGLIDAHVHTPPRLAFGNQELFSLLYLAHGVTSVRDTGQSDDSIRGLAQRLNRGRLVGPRMYRCGPVLDGDPPSWGAARSIVTAAQAMGAVEELAEDGVDCIKVYNELGLAAYRAIREAAAARNLPVIGHVPHAVGMANIHDFEAQHFTGIPYLRGGRPPLTSDFRDADFLSMTQVDIDAALDVALAQHISYLPTLANGGRLRLIASDPQRFPPTPGSAFLPEIWSSTWNGQMVAGHPVGEEIETRLARIPVSRTITREAHERGIDILAGTDTLMPWVVPGESLILEIDEIALATGDPEAALASATTVNGRHIAAGQIGIIAPGARADILLLPTDPTSDLAALRNWRIMFADGRRYERAQVDTWLERYRRHFHGAIYSFVMRHAARFAGGDKGHADVPDD